MTPSVSESVTRANRAPDRIEPQKKPRGWLRTIVILLILAGLGYGGYRWYESSSAIPAASADSGTGAGHGRGGGGAGRGAGGPPPVVVADSYRGDLPVYLDALGSVTALNTITVRSRVDGELIKVDFEEGQIVKKGDVIAEIDPRPYQAQLLQAQGQLIKDQAELKNAQADLERYTTARETVSQQQIDTAQANVSQFEGAIKIDQGVIDNANLQITYTHITAPLTGKIGLRTVDPGNIVHASDSTGIVMITQLEPIAVIFNLPSEQLPEVLDALKGDQTLSVQVMSSDRSIQLATGDLHAIDNEIDASTATVRIKAVLPNENGLLYPNQFVNVRLKVKTLQNVVLVPTMAVQKSPDSLFVYVVKSDKTVDMRPVTMGDSEETVSVITKGLDAGETVVTDGVDKLAPGMAVVPHTASASSQPSDTATTQGSGGQQGMGGQSGGQGQHMHQHNGNGGGGGHWNHSTTQPAETKTSENQASE